MPHLFESLTQCGVRNPNWALQAAKELGHEVSYLPQYERAWV